MVPIISLSLKSVFNFFKSQVHLPKEINNIQKEALQKKKKPKISRRYEKTLFRSFRTKLWLHLRSKQTKDEVKKVTWNTLNFTGISLVDKCKIYTKAKISFTSFRIINNNILQIYVKHKFRLLALSSIQ